MQRVYCSLVSYNVSNPTGPFCIHVSSICPTATGKQIDCKYCQYSEWVCNNPLNNAIQI